MSTIFRTTASRSWKVNIYIVTWNVSTKFPEEICVKNLLGLSNDTQHDRMDPDFFVIGLQEVNSQPQQVVMGLFKDDPWTEKFKDILKPRDYVLIKSEQMQGMLLIIFAKRKHILHLRNIETEYTRTGFGGLWGNKGAVSIRLSVYGCAISFVNAHLAAHDHELNERIVDFNQILQNHHYHVENYREIFEHDYVFWFGDLNFRLTGELSTTPEDIVHLVHRERLSELMEKDQLLLVRKENLAFHQLDENLPTFPPTYKFIRGTNEYDLKRRPAWTDRVLYKVRPHVYKDVILSVEQLSYKSHPNYQVSDHKPVTSEFIIKVIEDTTEKIIEFSYIPIWHINEENKIEYVIPADFEENDSDWIGVYKSDYSSFNEYVAYEYTRHGVENLQLSKIGNPSRIRRSICLEFSEKDDLEDGENYVLLYFQSTGIKGITSLAGISNVFRAEKRPPSPRFEAVD